MNVVTIVLICIIFVLLIALFVLYGGIESLLKHYTKLREVTENMLTRLDKIEKTLDDDCWY